MNQTIREVLELYHKGGIFADTALYLIESFTRLEAKGASLVGARMHRDSEGLLSVYWTDGAKSYPMGG